MSTSYATRSGRIEFWGVFQHGKVGGARWVYAEHIITANAADGRHFAAWHFTGNKADARAALDGLREPELKVAA